MFWKTPTKKKKNVYIHKNTHIHNLKPNTSSSLRSMAKYIKNINNYKYNTANYINKITGRHYTCSTYNENASKSQLYLS